jgi:basic membrane lipoprotein Med (substrate-binding protein (PBP1-ABC) superfamily)
LKEGKDLGKCFVGTVQKDKNAPNKLVLAFVQSDQLLISGWNEKKKKGEVQLVNWKKKKNIVLKDSWEQPRPFSMNGKKEVLFFGGSRLQNESFELLTFPAKKK